MMRTFICLLISCCIAWSVFAQSDIETTMRYGFFTSSREILPMDNGEVIIVGDKYESGGWGNNTLRLEKLDASGNTIWMKLYPEHVYFYGLYGAAIGTDNSIYISLENGGCDYGAWQMIMKFDSEGNYLWSIDVEGFYLSGGIKTTEDGGFWTLTSLGLYKYDSDGNHTQTIYLISARNFDYNESTNEFIVAFRDNQEVEKLRRINADGSIQEVELPDPIQLPQVYFWGDYILAKYFSKDILKYDQQLNLINEIELPRVYHVFEFDAENIYLSNKYIYFQPFDILKLNQNLEIIDSIGWEYGSVRDIATIDDELYVLGGEYHHTYLKSISNDFTYNDTNTDIGVVEILEATADTTHYYCGSNSAYTYDVTGIKAVVQNFGTETIDYFELNALYENECGAICLDYQPNIMIYENVNIAPGEVDTVDFSDIYIWYQYVNTQMCLYTTRPNQLLDKNHDNDEICRDFIYDGITAIQSVEEGLEFSISPNPATDIINLQNTQIDWQKTTINIINIEGKQIAVQPSPQINISRLPMGIYVIQCEYEGTIGSKRFVKYK